VGDGVSGKAGDNRTHNLSPRKIGPCQFKRQFKPASITA
jgi:hypothetical protein